MRTACRFGGIWNSSWFPSLVGQCSQRSHIWNVRYWSMVSLSRTSALASHSSITPPSIRTFTASFTVLDSETWCTGGKWKAHAWSTTQCCFYSESQSLCLQDLYADQQQTINVSVCWWSEAKSLTITTLIVTHLNCWTLWLVKGKYILSAIL